MAELRGLKTDSNEVDEGRCMSGSDGKLCFSEKERGTIWKDYVEWIMNKENDWVHVVDRDAVESPVDCSKRCEVVLSLYEMKNWKSPFTLRCIIRVD